MRLHRFIGDLKLNETRITINDRAILHQIKTVLRLRPGQKIIIGDGKREERYGIIESLTEREAVIFLQNSSAKKPNPIVSLYCSILKKENFEWVAQKATEIGISELIPIISERTIKKNVNFERIKKIIKEATEQSGRIVVPKLGLPLKFDDALRDGERFENIFLLDESGEMLKKAKGKYRSLALYIGPEGGWSSKEISLAREKAKIVSLSPFTLRAETAAIIASYFGVSSVIS